MAASHDAYNMLKMPGPMSIITIHADNKDAVLYIDKLYREAVVAFADKTLALASKTLMGEKSKNNTFGEARGDFRKRSFTTTREDDECGTFTISAALDNK
ncbi:hypothetical protein ZWY2020_057093 [Hordeum vulgare]|nr:hypothetical protein ZWY2020_057093 [Hordeum vulgare]